jgi:hypothetical protein
MYKLIRIIDRHSPLKSPVAIEIIKTELNNHEIEYVECFDSSEARCENDIVKKRGKSIKPCGMAISDLFVVSDGKNEKKIGNHCIQTLVEAKAIYNLDQERYRIILEKLKARNVCMLCGKNNKKDIHKKCAQGKGKNYIVSENQVKIRAAVMLELVKFNTLNKLLKLFQGIEFIQNAGASATLSKKTINAIKAFEDEHRLIVDNAGKLLALKNNCIVRSIRWQRRKPSVKQIAILEKILADYERIYDLDRECGDKTYLKYGYVYLLYK